MAVDKHLPLCQGECENAFCQGILPPKEVTIVQPPLGDPKAEPNEYWLLLQTLYNLHRSPRYWYKKINKILFSIGLTPSLEDLCLFTGFVHDPNNLGVVFLISLSPLASTLMTLFSSQRIPRLKIMLPASQ
jgi:hypothetical protein